MDRVSTDDNESLFLAGSGEVFVLLDAEGRCERVSRGGAAVTPVDFARWVGMPLQEMLTPESRAKLSKAFDKCRASTLRGAQQLEVAIPHDEGAGKQPRLFEATLSLSDDDLVALAKGESLRALYQHGRIRVDGDPRALHKMNFFKGLA